MHANTLMHMHTFLSVPIFRFVHAMMAFPAVEIVCMIGKSHGSRHFSYMHTVFVFFSYLLIYLLKIIFIMCGGLICDARICNTSVTQGIFEF